MCTVHISIHNYNAIKMFFDVIQCAIQEVDLFGGSFGYTCTYALPNDTTPVRLPG